MIDLINTATFSNDQQQRLRAEQQVVKIREENTEKFFIDCCEIFQNPEIASKARQATGTIINISIPFVSSAPQPICLWDKLQPNTKTNLKNSILSVLIDADRDIRRTAANIVASICCIEIPRNEWEGIIEKVSDNINNENPVVKEVSILTIGFICEKLKEKKSFVFNLDLQKAILTGILLGLKESQKQIIDTALLALRDGVSSMSDLLKAAQYRDYMVNQIVEVIRNEEYKNLGLQILTEFARGSYNELGGYISGFITLTEPIITKTSDEDNCIQAMEFWETVASEYVNQIDVDPNAKKHISGDNGQKIVSLLLQNLCVIEDESETDDSDILDSASKCLETIFEEDSLQFEKLALDFTSHTIKHQNWQFRQASIRAFTLFLMGVDSKRREELLNASLDDLVSLLNDQSKGVQYSAIKCLNMITEESSNLFIKHTHFIEILKLIVSKLSISEPFMKHACKIIDNLCGHCQKYGNNAFHQLADNLIEVLFGLCLTNESSLHSINCCILTIMSLIASSFNPAVSKKYLKFAVDHFPQVRTLPKEKRELLTASFLTLIQTCLLEMRKEKIEIETLSTIYTLVTNHYNSINNVDSDGLYVIGALSNFFMDDTRLVDDFWKFIEFSLREFSQSHIFNAALSCVCDFASNYGPALGNRIPIIMTQLIESLKKPEVSRESKIELISCIGEMFLNCPKECTPYLKETMDLILAACQASIAMSTSDKEYSEKLQDRIIETLTCLLHGLQNFGSGDFLPYVKDLFGFVRVTCDKSVSPRLDYVTSCTMFMADCSKFYKQKIALEVRQEWVYNCLETLKKFNKNGELSGTIQYAKENF